jgi:hypothetical protein
MIGRTCLLTAFPVVVVLAVYNVAGAATLRVPDDHKSIQAAIEAAAAGDTILVGAGTYRERVRLKPAVTLKSAGDDTQGELGLKRAEATVIDGNVAGAKGAGVMMAEDSTLDGFTVTGVGKYDDELWKKHHATQGEEQSEEPIGQPGTAGVAVIGVERCTVTNNIVHHVGYTGIAIVGVEGKRVSPHVVHNVTYRNMGGGIGSMKMSTAIIEENVCFENYYAGIGHNNASPLVFNNVCYANIRAGIGISEGSCPIVRGNKCYKNRRAGIGIRTGEETQPIVEHNECYENDMAGIGNRDDARPIIRHNRCYKNRMAGIGSRDGARAIIEFNECYENEMAGIGSRLGARPVIVENECFENKMAGIGSREGAAPIIRSNDSHHNEMAGIGSRRGARPVIVDNECRENQMAGIGVRDKETVAVIVGNRCLENRLVAIGLPDGATGYIHGNELKRTEGGAPPIVAIRGGAHAVVSNNLIHEGGVAGVLVSGTALISGNRFEGRGPDKQGSAIWIPFGGSFDFNSTVVASQNTCSGYRNLINANKANVTATDNITRAFSGPSLIVKNPSAPARVYGNTAISDNPKDTVVDVDGAENTAASNILKKPGEIDDSLDPGPRQWPLLARETNGNAYHPLANTGRQVIVQEGPWKLVVTYGKTTTYALFNTEQDPKETIDLAIRLEQITFRLRGLLEKQEGLEYQIEMRGSNSGR